MGFALFLDADLAWCQGRHEYQPMGTSVIARTDLFRDRDFRRFRRVPPSAQAGYRGLFASLGEVNACLKAQRARTPVTPPAEYSKGRQPVDSAALGRVRGVKPAAVRSEISGQTV